MDFNFFYLCCLQFCYVKTEAIRDMWDGYMMNLLEINTEQWSDVAGVDWNPEVNQFVNYMASTWIGYTQVE